MKKSMAMIGAAVMILAGGGVQRKRAFAQTAD